MSKSISFYNQSAEQYVADTKDLDLSAIYAYFTPYLAFGASILDIGCGSGRELVTFSKMGFNPTGLEPSVKLYEYAKNRSKAPVFNQTLFDFNTTNRFDAAWACASLLHFKKSELPLAFKKISDLLNPHGIFYCSFKEGSFEGERAGRYFTDMTEKSLKELIAPYFEVVEIWRSDDVRIDNQFSWVNLVGRKI